MIASRHPLADTRHRQLRVKTRSSTRSFGFWSPIGRQPAKARGSRGSVDVPASSHSNTMKGCPTGVRRSLHRRRRGSSTAWWRSGCHPPRWGFPASCRFRSWWQLTPAHLADIVGIDPGQLAVALLAGVIAMSGPLARVRYCAPGRLMRRRTRTYRRERSSRRSRRTRCTRPEAVDACNPQIGMAVP